MFPFTVVIMSSVQFIHTAPLYNKNYLRQLHKNKSLNDKFHFNPNSNPIAVSFYSNTMQSHAALYEIPII